MDELQSLSDRELRAKLSQHGIDIPVTKTTRDLAIRKLGKVLESAGNGTASKNVVHEEPVNPSPSSRRRSLAAPSKPKSTRQGRSSLAPRVEHRTDESEEEPEPVRPSSQRKQPPQQPSTPSKSLNGASNHEQSDSPSQQMSDSELLRQLASHNIPAQSVNAKNRPILMKKLNHALAKNRRESKSFTPKPSRDTEEESDKESEPEAMDIPDNNPVPKRASLSFSPQHSLTLLDNQSNQNHDPLLKPRLPDYSSSSINRPTFSPTVTVNRPTPTVTIGNHYRSPLSVSISRPLQPTPGRVVNRFVEEQECYDTGSDSETDSRPAKPMPKKEWFFMSWFARKTPMVPTIQPISPVKKSSVVDSLKGKVSIIWQWQFIAVILPILAAAFFALLAAFYIRASYDGTAVPPKEGSSSTGDIGSGMDPSLEPYFQRIRAYLEKDAVSKMCAGEEVTPLESLALSEQLQLSPDILIKVREVVESSPQVGGVKVEDGSWSFPGARLPLWCTIKTYLWNTLLTVLFIVFGFGVVVVVHYCVTAKNRQREKEEQEVYSLVEKIIDLLARHQTAMVSNGRPQDAFLAVSHVRDVLIPLKERKAKQKLWAKAVQFLEDNESRVRPEMQQIEGEDFRVWRWLPPSTTAYGPAEASAGGDEASGPASSPATPRPKVWQGQAFSTDSSGVNSPPPYPLTQCLKVRNMFDAEVEVGDSWPIRIQDAILEKAEKGKILHIAVDRGSREGCVYIKCSSADEAGKVYRSLHGWWFDGNLVTVKYLRPERYHYRFPDSAQATIPLTPSNDKRLSLQTKFWKSPLEHF